MLKIIYSEIKIGGMFVISIAMCTYNGERYIKQQLESILQQTLQPDEIIVCDDKSIMEP